MTLVAYIAVQRRRGDIEFFRKLLLSDLIFAQNDLEFVTIRRWSPLLFLFSYIKYYILPKTHFH